MRPVLHGDIVAAARVLFLTPEPERLVLCRRMIREAECAYRFYLRVGRPHPKWGSGSLMSAALNRPAAPEPSLDNSAYCTCIELVLRELVLRRAELINPGRS